MNANKKLNLQNTNLAEHSINLTFPQKTIC